MKYSDKIKLKMKEIEQQGKDPKCGEGKKFVLRKFWTMYREVLNDLDKNPLKDYELPSSGQIGSSVWSN